MAIDTITWQGDHVRMIDQTRLPNERVDIEIEVQAVKAAATRAA